MAFSPGSRIGPYELLSPLGAGGMGEVYRAKDLKLGREVAIKILPDPFASDQDRLARFQREAQVLASLNHPNIAAIYGLEDSDGTKALVLELVLGETLADRIARGPIPLDEALPIAKQIAEALEAAHEQGIIHRDLKPANIKITPDGIVKVLDFGLAKLAQRPSVVGMSPLSMSPTIASPAMTTGVGVLLGTAPYMSPEQAKGREADKRSDVWAFGCVLYEMLTGKRAFEGEHVTDVLAAVIRDEPDLTPIPERVRVIVSRCLRKDARRRIRDIGDVHIELDEPSSSQEQPVSTEKRRSGLAWAVAAVLALTTVVTGVIAYRNTRPVRLGTLRYTIAPPEKSTVHSFAISPDGKQLVIAAAIDGKEQLWLRHLDELQAIPMASTDGATYPFWSRDSRYIGFFAQGKLKKVAVTGAPAQALCDAPGARGGAWNDSDTILFASSSPSSESANPAPLIQRVPAAGGTPVPVVVGSATSRVPGTGVPRFPVFLPDGRHFLYTDIRTETAGVYVASLDDSNRRRILPDPSAVVFSHVPQRGAASLLFVRENVLMALPVDSTTATPKSDPFPIAEGVSTFLFSAGQVPVAASENDVMLYMTGGVAAGAQMLWHDRQGNPSGTVSMPGAIFYPAISPDTETLAFTRAAGGSADVFLHDLKRGTEIGLTSGGGYNRAPLWSPQGDRIAFTSSRAGVFGTLYHKATGESGQGEVLLSSTSSRGEQWSSDGRFIVFTRLDPATNTDVWVLPVDRDGRAAAKPLPFVQSAASELQGQLSPDGHWMAYTSDEAGQRDVYVRSFPSGAGKVKVSAARGGEQPRWRRDGSELFYVGGEGMMTSVAVKVESPPSPSLELGRPVALFNAHMTATGSGSFQYDVTGDGQRFLIVTTGTTATASSPITVIVNWSFELQRLMAKN